MFNMVSTCQDCQDEVRIFGDLQFLLGLSGYKSVKCEKSEKSGYFGFHLRVWQDDVRIFWEIS